jgi:HK97 family phage major capsid protein
MSDHGLATVSELLLEIKTAQADIQRADAERTTKLAAKADQTELKRLADEMAGKVTALQGAVERLSAKVGRPGGSIFDAGAQTLRESARGLLEAKFYSRVTKSSNEIKFNPSEDEIAEAETACLATKHLFKANFEQLPALEQKALSSFNMGASGFILQPEMSSRVLSCLVLPTDVTGLMTTVQIASGSIKFLVDDAVATAAWACETSCFANSPQSQLAEGLGEVEIRAETLRHIVCASSDVLEDAALDLEQWVLRKVSNAMRVIISQAVMTGSGIGMPLGILHPTAGVPVCDTGVNTPASQFSWQDLIFLKWQVPIQWQAGGRFLLNQNTFALLLTLSDALGRPLMIAMPTDPSIYFINGSPVSIVSQMPDVAPGATPVMFANLAEAYLIVQRKSVTMLHDPYSSGFCHLFKFEARVGGSVICANAARLLRIK